MKRILIFSLVLCLLLWNISFSYRVVAKTNITGEEKHTDYYDAFLVLLDPYARKAIKQKIIHPQLWVWNAEILEVNRKIKDILHMNFTIKVKYDTYTGPHNPPEGPVTITFDVK